MNLGTARFEDELNEQDQTPKNIESSMFANSERGILKTSVMVFDRSYTHSLLRTSLLEQVRKGRESV